MAGNMRFESSLADSEDLNFTGSYPNGQRLGYTNASLDRSGSFREAGENRMFNSGPNMGRGGAISTGDFSSLTHFLSLDPITMGDQKYTRSGELRRALGISFGSTTEDNSFGAAHSKPSPPLATEELKRFRASVVETSIKARGRAKKLDESLHNLNKYYEGLIMRKHQRKEMLTNERSSGPTLMKMGNQTHRNPLDPLNQRPDDRGKSMVLNKKVRSSVTELRADGRNPSSMRQPSLTGKDRDLLRDDGEASGFVEEKIRRLPAGGETWDKKMKRKRSVGAVLTRPLDGDGELRRGTLHKLNNDPGLQSPDSQGFRSASSNATSGTNSLDGTPLHPSLNARLVPKNELDKVSLLRDPTGSGSTKERLVVKGGNKLIVRDDNHIVSHNPLAKGKGSRTPRGGPITAGNSSPHFSRMSGAVDGWDHPPSLTKVLPVCGTNNRKRSMPTTSSSPPMAQWAGQRPQKMSRTRRANLTSPVSNPDEVQLSSEGCSPSDCGPRMASLATNGSLPSRGITNSNLVRMKNENVSSPARLSESEESGAVDNFDRSLKEKKLESGEIEERSLSAVSNVGCSLMLPKKKKVFHKEDISDFARRQGRSSRGSSLSNISPPKEKLEATSSSKLIKTMKPSLEKNGSKSGRPPKKMSDRKAFTRPGHISTGITPDIAGESDDDMEELLAAANLACNSSYAGCTSKFWRKMESHFSSVSSGDVFFLKQQLKAAEEKQQIFSQMGGHDKLFSGDGEHDNNYMPHMQLSVRNDSFMIDQNGSEHLARNLQLVDRDLANSCREINPEKVKKFPPLYERVLAALIAEDEIEEQENDSGRNMFTPYKRDDFAGARRFATNAEHRNGVSIDFESNTTLALKSQTCAVERIFCNGSADSDQLLNGEYFQGDHVFTPLQNGLIQEFAENGLDESLSVPTNSSVVSSFHCPWEEMCLEDKLLRELQSIGLCTETVPDLADGEGDVLHQAILDLEKKYHKQVGTVKFHLNKLTKVENSRNTERVIREHKAVNELVQLSYKKLLATRGSIASKFGVQKETKPSALGFMKKALSRCRLYEETGKSCFGEPPLLDAILAEPRHRNEEETTCVLGSSYAIKLPNAQISQPDTGSFSSGQDQREHNDKVGRGLSIPSDLDFAKTGPILNRGKKKEVLLDDVGGLVPSRVLSTPGSTLLGGAKGKRSERDRDKAMLSRNSVAKTGRLSMNLKGERKTKSKPKPKTDQLSPSGNRFSGTFSEATHSEYLLAGVANGNGASGKRESDVMTDVNNRDLSKKVNDSVEMGSLPMNDFDSIELGMTNELDGPQDIGSWLGFDDDGLQDHDSMGLDIPMDDLSDLNMII